MAKKLRAAPTPFGMKWLDHVASFEQIRLVCYISLEWPSRVMDTKGINSNSPQESICQFRRLKRKATHIYVAWPELRISRR
jgi:hypothetical protein